MRVGLGMLLLVLSFGLAGCGEDTAAPAGDPLSEVTIDCDQFAATGRKIAEAQTELFSGQDAEQTLDSLGAELDGLKDGAPSDVKTALADLEEAFRDAEKLLEKPSATAKAKLAALAPKLAKAGQEITAYITSKCVQR